jgi:hypothetical protein
MKQVNIFSALSSYGATESENYLTESFVFLLKLLLQRAPDTTLTILNRLVGSLPLHGLTCPEAIFINTQLKLEQGRPDIQIREFDDTLIYIEIKHDAPISQGQLECYYTQLCQSDYRNIQLVLLTRSRASASETTLAPHEYHHICWYEIYNWLAGADIDDEVSQYFIHDFLYFLEEKNMNLQKVSWEYTPGIVSLLNLTTMMEVAVREALPKAVLRRSAGWSWRGFFLDNAFFFGIRYEHPLTIAFENNMGNNPTAKSELDLEKAHFLALTKDEQFELISKFVEQANKEVTKGNTTVEPQLNDTAA